MDKEKFEKVLKGEIKTDGFTAEELVEYHKFVSELSKEEEKKLVGIRQARQAEEKKLADAKAEEEAKKQEAEAEEARRKAEAAGQNPEMTQFRKEQVEKAKRKLFGLKDFSDNEKKVIEEKFVKLDSGKLDADLIYEDFLSAFAAANPSKYMQLSQEKDEAEKAAAEALANAAGSTDSNPEGGEGEKKFSDEVMRYSKEYGITPKAAQKQMQSGMKRVHQ